MSRIEELIQLAREIRQEFATLHETMAELLDELEMEQKKAGD